MTFKISAKVSNSPQFINEKPLTINWRGIELTVASESIEKPTIWKIHENRHALIFHLGGKINRIETEINRRASRLNPPTDGEFWLIPANSEYTTYTQGESVRYAEFYFDADYLEKLLGARAKNYELLPSVGQFDIFLFQNVKKLVSASLKSDDISNLIGENISQTICLHLFGNYGAKSPESTQNALKFSPKRFELLQEYIHDNLAEKITLENLATIAEVSPHNLLRLFGKSFGKTPAQYIIEQRLQKARWLLANTARDITTIAFETGFASHSHLTSTFKKHVGLAPHKFRELY